MIYWTSVTFWCLLSERRRGRIRTSAVLTLWVAIEVVNKIGDGIIEGCGRDAVIVLTVIHKLQTFSLVHSY